MNWIAAEENGLRQSEQLGSECHSGIYPVQTHDIVIALPRVKLDGKAAWVPSRVGEFAAKRDGGKADEDGGFVAGLLQEVRLPGSRGNQSVPSPSHVLYLKVLIGAISVRQVTHVLGALEMAECPAAARVHHA